MNHKSSFPTYHVLLVGIDLYPSGYRSLHGCVNDIDAIEKILLGPPGIGFPPEQIRITRLAAPHTGQSSSSKFQSMSLPPTKANFIQALKTLASPTVERSDRVLIYYSGHGDEQPWRDRRVWHEALVPHNGQAIERLFDVEINALINAVAIRTNDVTIVLDCCHSAGATRDFSAVHPQGAIRSLDSDTTVVESHDVSRLGLDGDAAEGSMEGSHLLQTPEPDYLVVVACQSDERAHEGQYPPDQPMHGVLTQSFLRILEEEDAHNRSALRWSDIWPALQAEVARRNVQLHQPPQHPWIIGRNERKVFGGPWEKTDAGYSIVRQSDGTYAVGAGYLMGVSRGAEIAVYGAEPRLFLPLHSPEDNPFGLLKVRAAGPSSAVADSVNTDFTPPESARGRLVKPGEHQRMRVSLHPMDSRLKNQLERSSLLEITPHPSSDADVEVVRQPSGEWVIGNDVERVLAVIPAGEFDALRIGLEAYYRYHVVLRMARNCNDPMISNSINLKVLDCNNGDALRAMSPVELSDPDLPEAPRDPDRIYCLRPGFQFCFQVVNQSRYPLNVTLLACTSGGLVQYLSDGLLRNGAALTMWLDNRLGVPFTASPDTMPFLGGEENGPDMVTDRVIAIGTTRKDVNLRNLTVDQTVQQIVQEHLSATRGFYRKGESQLSPNKLSEYWTATVIPIRIKKKKPDGS